MTDFSWFAHHKAIVVLGLMAVILIVSAFRRRAKLESEEVRNLIKSTVEVGAFLVLVAWLAKHQDEELEEWGFVAVAIALMGYEATCSFAASVSAAWKNRKERRKDGAGALDDRQHEVPVKPLPPSRHSPPITPDALVAKRFEQQAPSEAKSHAETAEAEAQADDEATHTEKRGRS